MYGLWSYKTEQVQATGHKFGTWTLVTSPTCTTEGVEQRVCTNDSKHIETRAVEKTDHVDTNGDGACDNCGTAVDNGGTAQDSNCVCGKNHTGPFAWLVKFFHKLSYFFKNLFKR